MTSEIRNRSGTQGTIMQRSQQTIPPRSTLGKDELRRLNNTAFAVREGTIDRLQTMQLLQKKTGQFHAPEEEERVTDITIPVFSTKKDQDFKLLLIPVGGVLAIVLALIFSFTFSSVSYWYNHISTGERPVTHITGYFGFKGENQKDNIQTNVIAANQNGDIVIIVVPPDSSKTKIYQVQQFQQFSFDEIPFVQQVKMQGQPAIEVQVQNFEWFLVKTGDQFTFAHIA